MNDGKEKSSIIKTKVDPCDPCFDFSCYARVWDIMATNWPVWAKDTDEILLYLKHIEANANDILRFQGRLWLNTVYTMLGMPKIPKFSKVGWTYGKENGQGDNYVDFNIYNQANARFINGENSGKVFLDFNVEGEIF